MAVTWVDLSNQGTAGTASSSIGINRTTGDIANGDFQITAIVLPSSTTITSVPSGWTTEFDLVLGSFRLAVFTRFVVAGSGTSTWGFSASSIYAIISTAFLGVHPTDPWDVAPDVAFTAFNNTAQTSAPAPSVTPTNVLNRPLWLWTMNWTTSASSRTLAIPGDTTSVGQAKTAASSGHHIRWGVLTAAPTDDVPTGTKSATCATAGAWRAAGMVLREASVSSALEVSLSVIDVVCDVPAITAFNAFPLGVVDVVVEPTTLSVFARVFAPAVEVALELPAVSVSQRVALGVIDVVVENLAVGSQLRPPVNLSLIDVVTELTSVFISSGFTLSPIDVVVDSIGVMGGGSFSVQSIEVVTEILAVSISNVVSISSVDVVVESVSSSPGLGTSVAAIDVITQTVDVVAHQEAVLDIIDVVAEALFIFVHNTFSSIIDVEVEVLDVLGGAPPREIVRRPPHEFIAADVLRRDAPARNRGYRFLSVDSSTMRVTNEFEFAQVQYSFQRNAAGEFGAALDLYSPDAKFLIPQETFLVVERSGVPFWCGFMWKPRRNGKILEVGAQGIWSIFGHRHIRDTKSFFNTDRALIVRQLVQYAQLGVGGNLHVATGSETLSSPALPEAFFPWWEDKVIATEIENIALIDPEFNFRIEGRWLPGNVLTFDFIIDSVHPEISPHRLVYGGNVDDYEWEPIAPSPNHVDAFGGFDGPAMIRRSAQNLDALTRQPRIEVSTGNRDILTEEPVQNLAISTVKKLSGAPAQPTVTMQAGSDPQLGVLKIGQEVEVDIDDGYVQVHGRYIIERIEVTVPDGAADSLGAETLKISFESLVDDGLIGAL